MSEELETKLNVIGSNAKCKNCGSNVVFDPKTQSLVCPNCDSHFDFDKKQEEIKHEINEGKSKDDSSKHDSWAKEMKAVKCETCGAEIILSGLEMSKSCPYCGSDYVTEESILPGLKPDVVIPFMFNESDAGDLFLKGMKKKFFAPSALKKKLPANKIHGIYVPTFTFDADSVTKYDGVLLKKESHTDSDGHSTTTTIRIPIKGVQECTHRDYVVETSTKVNTKQMNAILPYKFDQSYVYDSNLNSTISYSTNILLGYYCLGLSNASKYYDLEFNYTFEFQTSFGVGNYLSETGKTILLLIPLVLEICQVKVLMEVNQLFIVK